MGQRIGTTISVLLVIAVAATGYLLLRANLTAEVYRDRLVELGEDYEALADQYNEAVRRTAVTELLVRDGKVCVTVRTAEGVIETIPTPFSAGGEVYVDYVVLDGRLWIRRVFDGQTPPSQGVVINPRLVTIDWDADDAVHGKAAYRKLRDGRWAVTVTGGGALGLSRVGEGEEVELTPPPAIRDYDQVEAEVEQQVEAIGPADVLKRLVAP